MGESVIRYMTIFSNSMVNAKDVTIMLIGKQEAGKTSLGHCLAGKITSASEILKLDRTQAFDSYICILQGTKVKIIDLGGHKEYESCLAVLLRENSLFICLLNPDDLKSEETIHEAVWQWVEKILDGIDSPHFLFVVSKIDE